MYKNVNINAVMIFTENIIKMMLYAFCKAVS